MIRQPFGDYTVGEESAYAETITLSAAGKQREAARFIHTGEHVIDLKTVFEDLLATCGADLIFNELGDIPLERLGASEARNRAPTVDVLMTGNVALLHYLLSYYLRRRDDFVAELQRALTDMAQPAKGNLLRFAQAAARAEHLELVVRSLNAVRYALALLAPEHEEAYLQLLRQRWIEHPGEAF